MKKLMDHQTCQGKRIRFEERKGSRKTENIARIVCFWHQKDAFVHYLLMWLMKPIGELTYGVMSQLLNILYGRQVQYQHILQRNTCKICLLVHKLYLVSNLALIWNKVMSYYFAYLLYA